MDRFIGCKRSNDCCEVQVLKSNMDRFIDDDNYEQATGLVRFKIQYG